MNVSEDIYRPAAVAGRFRRQAAFAWTIGLLLVLFWVLLIVGSPIAKAYGLSEISNPLFHFFGFICHQLPDRSIHIVGEQLAVCSRCFGVYFGLLFGFAVYPLWRSIDEVEALPRFWLFLSMIPIAIDWSLTIFGIWENTQLSRFITGMILGVACATFIIPALVEITRNYAPRSLTDRFMNKN